MLTMDPREPVLRTLQAADVDGLRRLAADRVDVLLEL
jgi:hypothetical protein